jgi:hypothetical protein
MVQLTTSYVRTSEAPERPTTALQSLMTRLNEALVALNEMEATCQGNADRIRGIEPPSGEKNEPTVVPNGTLGELAECVNVILRRIAAVRTQIERFNSI